MGEKIYTLRIEENLFEKIKSLAEKNKRSIAKEIEYQLEQNLECPPDERVFNYIAKLLQERGINVATISEIEGNNKL